MATDFTNPGSHDSGQCGSAGATLRQTAARKTANPRPIGRATRFAFALTCAAMLAAMAGEARARACKSPKLRLGPGCITAKDVKQDELTAKDRLDEPGASFAAPTAATRIDSFAGSLGPMELIATFNSKIPAGGVVIVSVSAVLAATTTDTYGAVVCDVIIIGPPPINRTVKKSALFGSVDDRDSLSFDSMAYMTGLTVDKKTTIKFELKCGLAQGAGIATNAGQFGKGTIDLQAPSVTVQYFPTRY